MNRWIWIAVALTGCGQAMPSAPMCSATYGTALSTSTAAIGHPCVAPQMAASGRMLQCVGVSTDITDTTGVFAELPDPSTMTCASGVAVPSVNARQSDGDPVVMFTACLRSCSADADCDSLTQCVSGACEPRRCAGTH